MAKLKDLIQDDRNANKGTARGAKALINSLQQSGAGRSIVVDRNGKIIGGNKVAEAAAEIFGVDAEVQVIETSGERLIVHKRNDLDLDDPDPNSPARQLAYADNFTSHLDFELDPVQVMADLEAGFDFERVDMGLPDLGDLMEGGVQELLGEDDKEASDTEAQVDRTEGLRQEWGVETGQIWRLGDHRLICGDCTDPAVVARVMDGERAVLCVTDPPYMVNYNPQWRVGLGGDGGKQEFSNGKVIEGDNDLNFLKVFEIIPADVIYCWTADKTIKDLQIKMEQNNFILCYVIIWNKDLAVFGRGDYHHKYEPCLYMVRKGSKHNWQGDRKQETVWDIPTIHSFANGHNSDEWGLVGHGNQKPLECMGKPIKNNSASGQIIYDPFLGSGTTIIACENLNRLCRSIEIDPGYVAVSLQRWTDHTGNKPERIG
jgi:DNA modification methylase